MTDYARSTGSSGTMLIRDYESLGLVEFWLTSNNTTTWSDHLPWGWTINGSTGNSTYNYQPGAGWVRLGNYSVTTSQTVTFRLGSTGTSGFGGPTTFSQFINRQTVPPAPTTPVISNVTSTSVVATYNSNGDGQSQIFEWQLGYGTDPNTALFFNSSGSPTAVSSLSPGTVYYFWARGRNALGWGPWSGRASATTLNIPATPDAPTLVDVSQFSAVLTFELHYEPFNTQFNGGAPITAYEIGYSTSLTGNPTTSQAASPPQTVNGLSPAVTYYFKIRARNSIGWSQWSAATVVRTIAGARIKVGAVWKDAIPYVRVGGVWLVARPWVRSAGVWKESL